MMFLINMDDFTSWLCMARVHTKIKQNWISWTELIQRNDGAELCLIILACAQSAQLYQQLWVQDTLFLPWTTPIAS